MMRLQSTNQGGFWKLCLTFFLKILVSVTSPTNSFFHIHTKEGLMHIYFVTNITAWCRYRLIICREKYKLGICKPYTKKWWQPQKNHTRKGRIRDFYIFCMVWNVPYNPRPPITGPVPYQAPLYQAPPFQALPYQTPHFKPLTISGPPHQAPIPISNPPS